MQINEKNSKIMSTVAIENEKRRKKSYITLSSLQKNDENL